MARPKPDTNPDGIQPGRQALDDEPACEICGARTDSWSIGATSVLWRCPSCGHVMRDLDRCWANARAHPWGGDAGFDRIRSALTMRSLRSVLPRPGPLDVLEIGFGRGMLLSRFLDRGDRVSGIDPGLLERGLPRALRDAATLYARPAESVELAAESFDLIYGIHVVEHLADPAAVFRACHRALRPGGVAYFMTPNAGSKGLGLFGEAWWNLEDPTHVRFFSRASISRALRDAGFDPVLTRIPTMDSLTLEISSLLRRVRRGAGEHGVLGSKAAMPVYAGLLPVAVGLRLAWPAIAPSMEVLARKGRPA
jgi:2-polyprenyl-3-methyl-5-hydroxy-6-metoxy-1,4-benzoquinol methylase